MQNQRGSNPGSGYILYRQKAHRFQTHCFNEKLMPLDLLLWCNDSSRVDTRSSLGVVFLNLDNPLLSRKNIHRNLMITFYSIEKKHKDSWLMQSR